MVESFIGQVMLFIMILIVVEAGVYKLFKKAIKEREHNEEN